MSANKKYQVGICFGCFDLIHIGHLNIFEHAKEYCEKLVVCVSSDDYVLNKKGHLPIIPYTQRLRMVSAMKLVDEVGIQSLDITKKDSVNLFKPDVVFVGSDWQGKKWDGEDLGIPVVYLPYTREITSTILRKKLGLFNN
jgi:glycerol-3-phosphate cytidylyltransferase